MFTVLHWVSSAQNSLTFKFKLVLFLTGNSKQRGNKFSMQLLEGIPAPHALTKHWLISQNIAKEQNRNVTLKTLIFTIFKIKFSAIAAPLNAGCGAI